MIFLLEVILLTLIVLLFIPVGIIGIFLVYRELAGFVEAERLLELLHVPLSYQQIAIAGYIMSALMFICFFLLIKLPWRR
jgi:hypothetical protein